MFRNFVTDLAPTFTLRVSVSNKRQKTGHGTYARSPEPSLPTEIDSEAVAYVLGHCAALGLTNELEQLLLTLETEANASDEHILDTVLIPLIKKFVDLRQSSASTERIQRFVRHIINSYIKAYVQLEPAQPSDWTRAPKGCGCHNCGELDLFLIDPRLEVKQFPPMAKNRWNHLSSKLPRAEGYDVSTSQDGQRFALVIRKTDSVWRRMHDEWQTRCQKASRHIEDIGEERFKAVSRGGRRDVRRSCSSAFGQVSACSHKQPAYCSGVTHSQELLASH